MVPWVEHGCSCRPYPHYIAFSLQGAQAIGLVGLNLCTTGALEGAGIVVGAEIVDVGDLGGVVEEEGHAACSPERLDGRG